MNVELCPATCTEDRIACTKPAGHSHLHEGGGWVWWHGNGEACLREDCHCNDGEATA